MTLVLVQDVPNTTIKEKVADEKSSNGSLIDMKWYKESIYYDWSDGKQYLIANLEPVLIKLFGGVVIFNPMAQRTTDEMLKIFNKFCWKPKKTTTFMQEDFDSMVEVLMFSKGVNVDMFRTKAPPEPVAPKRDDGQYQCYLPHGKWWYFKKNPKLKLKVPIDIKRFAGTIPSPIKRR